MNVKELLEQSISELPDYAYIKQCVNDKNQVVLRLCDLEHIVRSAAIATVERIDAATVTLNTNDPTTLYPLVRAELNLILTELNAVNAS